MVREPQRADLTRRRRHLLRAFAAVPFAAGIAPRVRGNEPQPVVVATSYHAEPMAVFEREFERAYPQYRLRFVWRMPVDILPTLRKPDSGIDVYWGASPRTFATLAGEDAFQPIGIDLTGLAARVGKTQISDPQQRYVATEMAGYGFAVNPGALAKAGLTVPADWDELAQAKWEGRIALPIPAQVGFAPPIVDLVLQAYGWDAGWALWSEIAANSRFVGAGANFVTDEVAGARVPLGVSIDFFVASAIANGLPIEFAYPRHTALNPGHVAVMKHATNIDGAHAFARFVLSDAGQALLGKPDIRKLPARESAYAAPGAPSFNPFAAAHDGRMDYDDARGRPRLALNAAVFEQCFVVDQAEHKAVWQRVHAFEAKGRDAKSVRAVLARPMITEAQADDPALQRQFARELEGAPRAEARPVELNWRAEAQARRRDAMVLLATLEAA